MALHGVIIEKVKQLQEPSVFMQKKGKMDKNVYSKHENKKKRDVKEIPNL